MALKDLVADKAALTEQAIESIIAPYVRYDVQERELSLTPEATTLPAEAKILVYLTANLGWKFVSDDPTGLPTRPANLESALGISGGTLRPALKKLREARLIHVLGDGNYDVRVANLDTVQRVVSGEERPRTKRRISAARDGRDSEVETNEKGSARAAWSVQALVDQGLFNEPKTLAEVKMRLEELGILIPQSQLSGPLLRAVRGKILQRRKRPDSQKDAWEYRRT